MSVKSFISIISLVLLCTATVSAYPMQDAVGEYYIPIGVPVIDGVISPGEWDKALWLDLNEVYYGDPLDLSNAKWAAMWSPDTNLIYVVVTGTDTVQIFGDSYGELAWNKYDLMETYVDVGNSDIQVYYVDGNTVREPAHQWMCGNDNNDGSWVVLPEENEHPDNNLPEEIRPLLVTSIDGNVLTYELAIPPYEWIGWLTDNTMNLMELETDMRIGLDVVMSSKSSTKFGMLCEHFWSTGDDIDGDGSADGVDTSQKWKFAERYLDHSLVADPNQAWRPRPHNKTTDVVPSTITLKWNPGKNAAAHDVYFSTSFDDVDDATDPNLSPAGKGRQTLENNTYTPDEIPLILGTTYYWRIDEVNSPTTVKGNIWRFTTAQYAIVDDFESYASTDELVGDGVSIAPVWADYWTNATGAELFLETSIARDGNSVKYLYDNGSAPYYSEADANIADLENVPSDWAALEVKALSLWFYGKSQNSITTNDKMYIALEDTSNNFAVVPYNGDANNLKLAMWQEWFIELQDFNDINNVQLSSIASIHIGFGNRYAPAAGGAGGTVYFDDIQISLPYCVPSEAEGDATGDCFINYDDLKVLAGDWCESEFTVPVAAPANELIWYKFDNEIQNNRAKDSSGNGYNGIITGYDWTTEGYIDGALNFDGSAQCTPSLGR